MQDPATFLTQQQRRQSHFEKSYLNRFGGAKECPECLPNLSSEIVSKKEKMDTVNASLEDARSKFEAWKTSYQRKQKEIDEKKKILDVQKQQLRTFADHHAFEIEKATKKREIELDKIEQIQTHIKELNIEYKSLTKKNEILRDRVEKLQRSSDYLNNVVKKSNYENVDTLLNRYETLTTTRNEYIEKFKVIMSKIGNGDEEITQDIINKRDKLLAKSMQMNRNKQTIDMVKKDNQYKKAQMCKNIQRVEIKNTELAELQSAIKTIFKRAYDKSITNAQKAGIGSDPTLQEMILFIKNRFKDLEGILNSSGK